MLTYIHYHVALSQRVTHQQLEPMTVEWSSVLSVLQRPEPSYQFTSPTCYSSSEQYKRDLQTRESHRRDLTRKILKISMRSKISSTHHLGENQVSSREHPHIFAICSWMKPVLQRPGLEASWSVLWAMIWKDWVIYQVLWLLILTQEESVKEYPHVREEIQHGACGKAQSGRCVVPLTNDFF